MKKKLIALAVAGAMTVPMAAMADVKISGVLQAEVVSISSDNGINAAARNDGLYMQDASTYPTNPASGPNSGEGGHNPSTLAFSASHDLGNGMKGLVMYSLNIGPDGTNGDRDAYIGLSGGFGTVLAGRMGTPYKSMYDPFLGTFMQARGNGGASAGVFGHGSYVNNALAYANKFGPATVVAALVIDETPDTTTATSRDTAANHALSFSVKMPVGPVELSVAHTSADNFGGNVYTAGVADGEYDSTEVVNKQTFTKLAAKYSAGDIVVGFQYEDRDRARGIGGAAETYMLLMGSYKMGANTLSASYGVNTRSQNVGADMDTTYMAVGVTHAMSNKVRLHGGYRVTSPDVAAGAQSADESVIGAGMRVSF